MWYALLLISLTSFVDWLYGPKRLLCDCLSQAVFSDVNGLKDTTQSFKVANTY